jgi:aspartyl-tRNA(Asn)/glutamyl-tRNA(Gln) amidotransferase subunit B
MPELPGQKRERFINDFGLSAYDATALTANPGNGRLFRVDRDERRQGQRQALCQLGHGRPGRPPQQGRQGTRRSPVSAAQLAGLIQRIADNTISNNIAKKVFEALWNGEGATADEVIDKQGLKQITDSGAIEALVDEVLAANASQCRPNSGPARKRPSMPWSVR